MKAKGVVGSIPKLLLFGLLAGGIAVSQAQTNREPTSAAASGAAPSAAHNTSPYQPMRVPTRAKNYYQSLWGVDNMLVRQTASGNLIRFSYRVVDPVRAKPLGDKAATPYMLGLRSRALLHIPTMENVGQLRQSGEAKAGQEYWMVFSNKGNPVKAGDRVNVIIGAFHANGLLVE